MGCFDVFCLICTNPASSANILKDINIERDKEGNEPFNISKVHDFVEKTQYLTNCSFLTENNEIVHECYEYDSCGKFKDKENNTYGLLLHKEYNEHEKIKYGIFVHTDCWQYIKNKYDIELNFLNIKTNIISDLKDNLLVRIEYGNIIDKYIQGQYMDFKNLFADDNLYLSYSPLNFNQKNNERIDNNIQQIIA
jgi:hypothetical protein